MSDPDAALTGDPEGNARVPAAMAHRTRNNTRRYVDTAASTRAHQALRRVLSGDQSGVVSLQGDQLVLDAHSWSDAGRRA